MTQRADEALRVRACRRVEAVRHENTTTSPVLAQSLRHSRGLGTTAARYCIGDKQTACCKAGAWLRVVGVSFAAGPGRGGTAADAGANESLATGLPEGE